jgi:hypothetical protein
MDFAEVYYFFRLRFGADQVYSLALVSIYSNPNQDLLRTSYQTIYACSHQGNAALQVIDIKSIISVVALVPFFVVNPDGTIEQPEDEFFLVEKPGLDVATLIGEEEEEEYDGENEEDDFDV